jgi:CRP-like cAMP-binding protein
MVRVVVPAGETVVYEGDLGDRVYVIESGSLAATFEGRPLSTMGPGECFGEIALLRDVPRTATVRADTAARLYALERDDFLAIVTGNSLAHSEADAVAAERLARD